MMSLPFVFGSLFVTGLILGSTLCNLTCGPLLLMRILGRGRGWKDGVAMALIFTSPRIAVLSIFGAIVGSAGSYASKHLDAGSIPYVHASVYMIIALIMVLNGIGLARGRRKECSAGSPGLMARITSRFADPGHADERLHLFALGLLFSLVCIGEAWGFLGISLVEGALAGTDPATGALIGGAAMLSFSLGLSVPPVAAAALASEAAYRIDMFEIARAGGYVLILIGVLLMMFELYSIYSLLS